jgi:hypothetical protein
VTAALLGGYAVLLGTVGGWLLRRSRWPERAPRLGLLAWQGLSGTIMLSTVLAGIVLVVPESRLSLDLADLVEACAMTLRQFYATPGGAALGVSGAALGLAVVARLGYCTAAELVVAGRRRRQQLEMLALVGRQDDALGSTVVEYGTAAAYCLAGRRRRIVVTTAALQALDPDQLRAVIAHEIAHLNGRHHLVTAGARALARAFPCVPTFRYAAAEVERLVEMLADDAATRRCDRWTVATALVALAEGSAPRAALAAGGPTALARVRRLVGPVAPLGVVRRAAIITIAAGALVTPVVLAATPAVAAARADYCLITLPAA